MEQAPIRVRMAPSPTGHLHVGTAKTALFNWLYARRYGGTFVLRIEDTDSERSRDEFAREIVQGLSWLGLDWDEGPYLAADGTWMSKGDLGPYVQSERGGLYRAHLERLLQEGKAYWCYCTKDELDAERARQQESADLVRYAGTCRALDGVPAGREAQVIRIRVPEKTVTFDDLVRGPIETDLALLGDLAIARSLDSALYNFAVVVDDALMRITHVIRGEDHISNTPKQLLVFEALGYEPPRYAHLPLNLDADRKKMSKRSAEVSLLAYRDQGFLPGALSNFLALLGWHPSGDQETFTPAELIDAFSIDRVQRSGAIFDEAKLRWLNREHLRHLPAETLARLLRPFLPEGSEVAPEVLDRFATAEQGRSDTLADLAASASWLVAYATPSRADLLPRQDDAGTAREHLMRLVETLEAHEEDPALLVHLEAWLAAYAETHGKREVFWPVRVALSGSAQSPDPLTLVTVLGPEESRRRLALAADTLAG